MTGYIGNHEVILLQKQRIRLCTKINLLHIHFITAIEQISLVYISNLCTLVCQIKIDLVDQTLSHCLNQEDNIHLLRVEFHVRRIFIRRKQARLFVEIFLQNIICHLDCQIIILLMSGMFIEA